MNHLRLHDIWLYLIAILLFGIFLLLLYIVYRCSDRVPQSQIKRRKESIVYFNIDCAPNHMLNFAEWTGNELPTYISQWSFQDECDAELEWKRQLSLKSHCSECEKLLNDNRQSRDSSPNKYSVNTGNVTAV